MEIWLVWVRDGPYGDVQLTEPAHRTRESAQRWCNVNRKLSGGDPVEWGTSGGADPVDYGESKHVVTMPAFRGRRKITETRYYLLQVMKLED